MTDTFPTDTFPQNCKIACRFSVRQRRSGMAMLTIDLEDEIARHVEESARREHKSVSDWVKERLKPENDPAAALAAMESRAIANGYPPGWLTLFGSLAE